MNIIEIVTKENYVLYIRTDHGEAGLFDVKPYLEYEAFSPLKSRNAFERIVNGKYFIEWECGADLSMDTIKAKWKPSNKENGEGVRSDF